MIDDLLDKRVDVTSFEPVQDVEGGYVNSNEVVERAYVPCRVTPVSSAKRASLGQWATEATHVLHFSGALYLTPQNKIYLRVYYRENYKAFAPDAFKDRVFEVLGSRVPDELAEFTIVACKEYNPGESE